MNGPKDLPKDCCPMCGYQFEEVHRYQICPRCKQVYTKDQLITEDDDYAYTL